MMSRRLSFALTGLMLLASLPAKAQDAAAVAPISALNAGLLQAMKAGKATPFADRYKALAPIVGRAFDLQAVLKSAVGPRWDMLPADQQQQLLGAFTRFTVATYVANFDNYTGQKLQITGGRTLPNAQVVETQIVAPGADPVQLDYVMRQANGEWRATDVLLQGSISQDAVKRSDFLSLLKGGNAQPLIQNLNQKADDLSAGGHS